MWKLFAEIVGILGPSVVWFGIWFAAQRKMVKPHSVLGILRACRWIAWIAAGVLLFLSIHLDRTYWAAIFLFSLGLSFPESWLRRHTGE
jgi:hypothetical protein